MIVNGYAGRCPCGVSVPARKGFVVWRKIVCGGCALEADLADAESRAGSDSYFCDPDDLPSAF